jgi:hypothetical protein
MPSFEYVCKKTLGNYQVDPSVRFSHELIRPGTKYVAKLMWIVLPVSCYAGEPICITGTQGGVCVFQHTVVPIDTGFNTMKLELDGEASWLWSSGELPVIKLANISCRTSSLPSRQDTLHMLFCLEEYVPLVLPAKPQTAPLRNVNWRC